MDIGAVVGLRLQSATARAHQHFPCAVSWVFGVSAGTLLGVSAGALDGCLAFLRAPLTRAAMSQKPRFVQNALLPLEMLSLGERSGWRNRSTKRVGELRTTFADGQFGQSVACGVQVLPVEDADGASFIDDGVSTVQALVELKAARAEGKLTTDTELLAIFEQGLQVTVATYPDNDDLSSHWISTT